MQKDEEQAFSVLADFTKTIEENVDASQGEVIQFFGDGCLLAFDSVHSGVACAITIQKKFISINVPVRIGIHVGEVVFKNGNVFGDGVNIASRIESFGTAGSILISKTVQNQIHNNKSFQTESLGYFNFKNIVDPIELFAISTAGIVVPHKNKITGKGAKASFKKPWLLFAGLLLLSVLGIYIFSNYNRTKHSINAIEKNDLPADGTIAVLPLVNLNQRDEDLSYFSNGLSQEIIDQLAKVNSLKVTAFSQSFYYNDKDLASKELAKKLDVKYLVSGSMRVLDNGENIKLSFELFNPHTNELIWNTSFLKNIQSISSIQVDIAKEVIKHLNLNLSGEETASLEHINTENGEAFKLFLIAKSEIDQLTTKSLKRSQQHLREAISLDSSYAQAYILLAWSLALTADPTIFPGAASAAASINMIEPILEKGLSLDPKSSDAHLVRASINLFNKNRIGDALVDVEKALDLKSWPRVPTNFCTCIITTTFVTAKDAQRAKETIALSKKLDPDNVLLSWDKANVAMMEGDYLNAQLLYKSALDRFDDFYFNTFLGWSYYHDNDYTQSLKYLESAYQKSKLPMALTVAYLSNVHHQLGDQLKSDEYLRQLENRKKNGEHHLNLYLSMVYAVRKDNPKALAYLQQSFIDNEHGLAIFTSIDPVFVPLNKTPQFISIRNKMQF